MGLVRQVKITVGTREGEEGRSRRRKDVELEVYSQRVWVQSTGENDGDGTATTSLDTDLMS